MKIGYPEKMASVPRCHIHTIAGGRGGRGGRWKKKWKKIKQKIKIKEKI